LSRASAATAPERPSSPDHVREHLQPVHEIAPRPHHFHPADRAERDQQAVDPAIRQRDAGAEHVLEELLAVIRPADQRRVAEQEHAQRHHRPAEARERGFEGRGDDGGALDLAGFTAAEFQAPLSSTVNALMLDVTNETMKTSITAFSPCWTGRSLWAVP
jgi:hypothetical protein